MQSTRDRCKSESFKRSLTIMTSCMMNMMEMMKTKTTPMSTSQTCIPMPQAATSELSCFQNDYFAISCFLFSRQPAQPLPACCLSLSFSLLGWPNQPAWTNWEIYSWNWASLSHSVLLTALFKLRPTICLSLFLARLHNFFDIYWPKASHFDLYADRLLKLSCFTSNLT